MTNKGGYWAWFLVESTFKINEGFFYKGYDKLLCHENDHNLLVPHWLVINLYDTILVASTKISQLTHHHNYKPWYWKLLSVHVPMVYLHWNIDEDNGKHN